MSDENDSSRNYKSTPPTNKRVRNPFDKALIGALHKPICSPGMCKIYKKKSNGKFGWDIDQACALVPQDIIPCNSQFEPSPDPVLERIAEEATEKFFSQEMVMPSPLEPSKKTKMLQISFDASIQSHCATGTTKSCDASAQTVLTIPPELPPELEKMLAAYCTFTLDQNISGDYEITANGSLCRKLLFEEHSDVEHYDSEQTDDEAHVEKRPPSSYEAHTPVVFSPDVVSKNVESSGMKRTFGTPLKQGPSLGPKCFRNKIFDSLDVEPCFSPIQFRTPKRAQDVATPSSFTSTSISPLKGPSSDEEKNNFTSPESEAMATCLDCVASDPNAEKKGQCFCTTTPEKFLLKRSTSLKESPTRGRKSSLMFLEKRSLSMSSLHRSRSVQRLDFSLDMSVDGSVLDHTQHSDCSPARKEAKVTWSLADETSLQAAPSSGSYYSAQSFRQSAGVCALDQTPVKGKARISTILTHEISKIRTPKAVMEMSLDGSVDDLNLEHKKVDFNNVDLKFLTDDVSRFEATNRPGESSVSFKRTDSGFNECSNFYTNASSYYESAIKPSELTVTNIESKTEATTLKEISNVNWMRIDSGFNENSADSMLYRTDSTSGKPEFRYTEARFADKENDYERFFIQPNKNEAMSMSEIFTEDMTFNCNFSSTPSKNKPRKL